MHKNNYFILFSLKVTDSRTMRLPIQKLHKVSSYSYKCNSVEKFTLIMDMVDILVRIIDTESENFYL
jgi:hypothetical protein